MCLQKGVGIGKRERCSNENHSLYKNSFLWVLVITVIVILIFIYIHRRKSREPVDDKKKGRCRV